jgi:hypothetical protein
MADAETTREDEVRIRALGLAVEFVVARYRARLDGGVAPRPQTPISEEVVDAAEVFRRYVMEPRGGGLTPG